MQHPTSDATDGRDVQTTYDVRDEHDRHVRFTTEPRVAETLSDIGFTVTAGYDR